MYFHIMSRGAIKNRKKPLLPPKSKMWKYVWLENLPQWKKMFQQHVGTNRKTLVWVGFQFYFFSASPNSRKTWKLNFVTVRKEIYIFLKLKVVWYCSQTVLKFIFLEGKKITIHLHQNKIIKINNWKIQFIHSNFYL